MESVKGREPLGHGDLVKRRERVRRQLLLTGEGLWLPG